MTVEIKKVSNFDIKIMLVDGSTQVEITGDEGVWGTWSSVVLCGHLYNSYDQAVGCSDHFRQSVEEAVEDFEIRHSLT